jgi:hypothetical protein
MHDYPPEFDAEYAYEIVEGGLKVAWTEDDNVYVYVGADKTEREDGYLLIGTLEWMDDLTEGHGFDTYVDEEHCNLVRLRGMVQDWRRTVNI